MNYIRITKDMLDMMLNGSRRVSVQNLEAVTTWYESVN